jgi:hypothetical protein
VGSNRYADLGGADLLVNWLARGQSVFNVEPDCVVNQCASLVFRLALGVTALEPRADRKKTAVLVPFNHDCELVLRHVMLF